MACGTWLLRLPVATARASRLRKQTWAELLIGSNRYACVLVSRSVKAVATTGWLLRTVISLWANLISTCVPRKINYVGPFQACRLSQDSRCWKHLLTCHHESRHVRSKEVIISFKYSVRCLITCLYHQCKGYHSSYYIFIIYF